MDEKTYVNPLVERFATPQMVEIFSPQKKFATWRRVWLALAEAQSELGLDITHEQLEEMRCNLDRIDLETAKAKEREIRHDVMAHLYAFGLQCPKAKPIIHLGATSEFMNGNTDLLLMREALLLVRKLLVNVLERLMQFAEKYRDLPTLGLTHFQPAQPVTVGKRAVLWAQDLLFDLDAIERLLADMKCRGAKGTTGTQASYLHLFDGDHEKVKRLDRLVAQKLGFSRTFPVTGQTYPRKIDTRMMTVLAGIGESAHKFATDMRLLQGFKEIEEPFEEKQTGSSAMAYKRNPMRCERLCSLARHLMLAPVHASFTSATQWFERTLDDSSNRRLSLPEAFLAADAILNIMIDVARGLVHPEVPDAQDLLADGDLLDLPDGEGPGVLQARPDHAHLPAEDGLDSLLVRPDTGNPRQCKQHDHKHHDHGQQAKAHPQGVGHAAGSRIGVHGPGARWFFGR